jgi:hypothetical protein
MGEVVNVAFLARDWAETHAQSGMVATARVTESLADRFEIVQTAAVHFKGLQHPVCLCELREKR